VGEWRPTGGILGAMTDRTAFWVEVPRDFLMISGPDAQTYLHSQVSQEIRDLAVGQARWSLVLQPTGKVDALVRILRSGDTAFVLDTDGGWGDRVLARLQRFKIRVTADLERIPWRCIAVRGADVAPSAGSVAVPAWWGAGVDLLGPSPVPPPGVPEGSAGEYERSRILAGWPALGVEITESSIPAETGLADVAVSFTKGCYPGQELVERMDSRGSTAPRLLRRVVLPHAAGEAAGTPVRLDGAEVGRITSSSGDAALALISRSVAVPHDVVVALPGGDQPARLEAVNP
jgi:tRNA-modifying protein YgfZ